MSTTVLEATRGSERRHRRLSLLGAWFGTAVAGAAAMLIIVLVVAELGHAAPHAIGDGPPFVVGGLQDMLRILGRNVLVLALFSLFAWLLGRPARRDDRLRARVVTRLLLAGVLVAQCSLEGRRLGGVSAYLYVPSWRLMIGVLPHALLELAALLLPLAAIHAAERAHGADLRRLGPLLALPLLLIAAGLEVYVSPHAYHAIACTDVGTGLAAKGGCGVEPCPRLSPQAFERKYHIPVAPSLVASYRGRCSWPAGR